MKFDIAFIDSGCNKPYTFDTLETDSLGGTEGSTIRLAEGFASMGHKVCVVQRFDFLPTTSPGGVRYLPYRWLTVIKPTNVIHLRARMHWDKFPQAKQFTWLHDAVSLEHNNISDWHTFMKPFDMTLVAVSDWHIQNIKNLAPTLNPIRIYSPVDEQCYNFPRKTDYLKNQMVWMSSPHKGLGPALDTFFKLTERIPVMRLVVFNPGYFQISMETTDKRLILQSETKRSVMRETIEDSLCLFYPTQFEETFGLVAAEANALGIPVACYKVAALAESCGNEFAANEAELLDMVERWFKEGRPRTQGQDRFRFPPIYADWRNILNLN